MRDIDEKPYSPDEMRVAEFFASKGAGGGDDPIAFMLCSYEWLVEERKTLRAALDRAGAEKAAWVDMAYERGLGDPEETAFQLDGDSKQIANQKHNITELLTERDALRAELAVVREALEWYADQNNWKWSNGQGFYASAVHMIMSDQGHKARNALQSHRRTEEGT